MRVGEMVRQLVGECSAVAHAARLGAVVKAIEESHRAGGCRQRRSGRNLPGGGRPKDGIKCVDRLLGNPHLARDRLFLLAVAHRLLRGWARPIILVDWTQAGSSTHQASAASAPIGGRAPPIYLEVHPQKKLSNVAVEKRFLSARSKRSYRRSAEPSSCQMRDSKGPFFQRCARWDGTSWVGCEGPPRPYRRPVRRSRRKTSTHRRRLFRRTWAPSGSSSGSEFPAVVVVRKRRRPGPSGLHRRARTGARASSGGARSVAAGYLAGRR